MFFWITAATSGGLSWRRELLLATRRVKCIYKKILAVLSLYIYIRMWYMKIILGYGLMNACNI